MQETNSRQTLCSQLKTVDASLLFLLFIILSVVLSYAAVGIQRRQLADTLAGNTQAAAALPPVFPIRCCASALVIGALGFFLCLALNAWQQASQGDDPVARKSAAANLCASVLVLAAALLRLDDLLFLQRCQPALEERRPARLSGAKGGQEILSPWYPSSAALPPGRR